MPFSYLFLTLNTRPPLLLPRLAPGEMHNRHNKEAIAIIRDTRQGIVPRREGRQQGKETSRFHNGRVRVARGVTVEVSDAEEHEGHVEGEEEGEEGEGGLERAEDEEEGEDEPALGTLRISDSEKV